MNPRFCTECHQIVWGPFFGRQYNHVEPMRNRGPDSTYMCGPTTWICLPVGQQIQIRAVEVEDECEDELPRALAEQDIDGHGYDLAGEIDWDEQDRRAYGEELLDNFRREQ